MKKYIMPIIKVKEVEIEQILTGSDPASDSLDSGNSLQEEEIEAKKYGKVSVWDE